MKKNYLIFPAEKGELKCQDTFMARLYLLYPESEFRDLGGLGIAALNVGEVTDKIDKMFYDICQEHLRFVSLPNQAFVAPGDARKPCHRHGIIRRTLPKPGL